MFITEHDPYHPKAGSTEYNLINGAGLVKSLYFTSLYSPGVKIMPWVQYHDGNIQTRFMWFEGPNEPDTKAEELRMLLPTTRSCWPRSRMTGWSSRRSIMANRGTSGCASRNSRRSSRPWGTEK